jgi:hypothetical protein
MVRSSKENQIKMTLLGFCTNTFSCGIIFPGYRIYGMRILGKERKNDNRDKRKGNSPIAVSCVVISPNKNSFGLGASAHPDYRHSKIATHLI